MRLKNKVAIVTGAASGFGKAIATRFVEEGAVVVVADINGEGAARVAMELGEAASAFACDVTRRDDVEALVAHACVRGGKLNVVVNNAGWTHRNQPMLGVDEESFDRVFDTNVKSIFHMTHAAVPRMRAAGSGVILNVASVAGLRPRPGLTWYNGSKGAANLLSKSLAAELAPDGIRVNAICPVIGATGMIGDFLGAPDTPENRQRFLATIPLGRFCEPDDVAYATVYLASDEASFITGVEFPVDGGRCI